MTSTTITIDSTTTPNIAFNIPSQPIPIRTQRLPGELFAAFIEAANRESTYTTGTKRARSPSSCSTTSSSTTSSSITSSSITSSSITSSSITSSSTSSSSTTSTATTTAPRPPPSQIPRQARPRPSTATFPGTLTILSRKEALRHAKIAYHMQFRQRDNANWHVFWVDASLNENLPGAAGAGVVYNTDGRIDHWVDYAYAVEDVSEINDLELFAIGAAFWTAFWRIKRIREMEEREGIGPQRHKVSVFSDSQTAIRSLGLEKDTELAQSIAEISERLADLGVEVEVHWIPGHTGHVAHQRADRIARAGARYGVSYLDDRVEKKGKVEKKSKDGGFRAVDSRSLKLR